MLFVVYMYVWLVADKLLKLKINPKYIFDSCTSCLGTWRLKVFTSQYLWINMVEKYRLIEFILSSWENASFSPKEDFFFQQISLSSSLTIQDREKWEINKSMFYKTIYSEISVNSFLVDTQNLSINNKKPMRWPLNIV